MKVFSGHNQCIVVDTKGIICFALFIYRHYSIFIDLKQTYEFKLCLSDVGLNREAAHDKITIYIVLK